VLEKQMWGLLLLKIEIKGGDHLVKGPPQWLDPCGQSGGSGIKRHRKLREEVAVVEGCEKLWRVAATGHLPLPLPLALTPK
jgi:hypothetical protein